MSASASKSELRDVIRAAGMRATASRIAVLNQLRNAARPVSHAEIVGALDGEPWDRATLYRNLVDLTNAGLARKVELGDRVWRFEDSGSQERHDAALHPHFVCTVCGSVSCLPDAAVTGLDGGPQRTPPKRPVEVHLRGVCDSCDP